MGQKTGVSRPQAGPPSPDSLCPGLGALAMRIRLTVGRLLAAMIPLAAYLALGINGTRVARESSSAPGVPAPLRVSLQLALIAGSGAALAAYRRASCLAVV